MIVGVLVVYSRGENCWFILDCGFAVCLVLHGFGFVIGWWILFIAFVISECRFVVYLLNCCAGFACFGGGFVM